MIHCTNCATDSSQCHTHTGTATAGESWRRETKLRLAVRLRMSVLLEDRSSSAGIHDRTATAAAATTAAKTRRRWTTHTGSRRPTTAVRTCNIDRAYRNTSTCTHTHVCNQDSSPSAAAERKEEWLTRKGKTSPRRSGNNCLYLLS